MYMCIYYLILLNYLQEISPPDQLEERAEPWRVLDDRNVSVYICLYAIDSTQFNKTVTLW